MTEQVECAVVGAGVVGLAVARKLASEGREVVLLESESAVGTGNSSRNSEVIHSGLHYPEGSLKAKTCVAGQGLLYDYCARHGVATQRIGKLIVAADDAEVPRLEALLSRGRCNGVEDLAIIDREQLRELEPEVAGVAAMFSPTTGIVDSHAFMQSLLEDFTAAGGTVALDCPVLSGRIDTDGIFIRCGDHDRTELGCRYLVNTAGLGALALARSIKGRSIDDLPEIELVKGHYLAYSGASPFRHLVYPLPSQHGLGVHATLDLAGRLRFGPDTSVVDTPSFDLPPDLAKPFATAIRRYWPALPEGRLHSDYAGVRTKARGSPDEFPDFILRDLSIAPKRRLFEFFGIESPGLTAALALAEMIMSRLEAR